MIKNLTNKAYKKTRAYIPGEDIDKVKEIYGLTEIVKLASNENPIGVSPLAIEAMNEASKNLNLYPDPLAISLRRKLGQKLGFSEKNIMVSNGASGVLRIITETLIEEGDEVIYGKPSFPAYYNNTVRNGGTPIEVPLTKDYVYDLEKILESITDKTKVIIICNPNNPTGTILSYEAIGKFLEKVPSNILVVVDEAYIEFISQDNYKDCLDYIEKYSNLMVIRTFSKIYGLAGVRVGYGIASEEIIETFYKAHQTFVTSMPALCAAEAALEDDKFIEEVKVNNQQGKIYLTEEFVKLGFDVVPSEANFIFVDMKRDVGIIFEEMMKKGCILRPAGKFARVTIGTKSQNKKFISALIEVIR
jgi:histidinol-phosphate aminotransferase